MAYVYKITYPNGKIYIGAYWHCKSSRNYHSDYFFSYIGSSSNIEKIETENTEHTDNYTIKKEILYKCDNPKERGDDYEKELLRKEQEFIIKCEANNPKKGYNLRPKWQPKK